MPSQLNIWANQMDPIIPISLRKSNWKLLLSRAPQTTMTYDEDVRLAIADWVYRRLLPMVTPVAAFSDEGDEWRYMIERRVLNIRRFKNRTLERALRELGAAPIPQYGEATKLCIREIQTLRKTWRGFDLVWTKDLDIVGTFGTLTNIAEHGGPKQSTPD